MFVRVWEYEVPASNVDAFVVAYAADGDWARLFARANGYLGTELYRDMQRPGWFVTVDRWSDERDWRRFLDGHGGAYAELDAALARLVRIDRPLVEGSAPSGVRPHTPR